MISPNESQLVSVEPHQAKLLDRGIISLVVLSVILGRRLR
jgi:hypothetical protein